MIRSTKYSLIFKTMLFCAAAAALWLRCSAEGILSPAPFRYFSVLSAALTGIYYFFALIAHTDKGIAVWFPCFKLAVTLCALLTAGVTAYALPDYYVSADTLTALSVVLTHWVLPIGLVLDWLLFDPHGVLKLWMAFAALLPSGLYLLAAWYGDGIGLSLAALYWFLDRASMGEGSAWLVALGFGGAQLIVGLLCCGLDHLLSKIRY